MKKNITACMMAVPLICVCYFLMLPKAVVNMTNYFSFGVIASGFLIWLYQKEYLVKIRSLNKKYYLYAAVCTIIFLIMLPAEDLFQSPLFHFQEFYHGTNTFMDYLHHGLAFNSSFVKAIYCVLMAGYMAGFLGYTFLLMLFYFTKDPRQASQEDINSIGRIGLYRYTAPIIFVTIIYMISAVPVMKLPDYVSVLQTEGVWDFWKPLAWQYFISIFSKLDITFMIVLIQAVFWIVVNHYAIGVIYRYAGKRGCRLYTVWSIAATYPYMQLISSYDNSIFTTAFLGLIAAEFDILQKGVRTKRDNLIWITFCTIVMVFRSEGLYLTIAITAVQLFYEYFQKMFQKGLWIRNVIFLVFVQICVAFLIPQVSGMQISQKQDYWRYGLPLNNLAGIASYGLQMDEKDIAVLEKIMPLEEWKENYMPENSDNVSKPWGAVGDRIVQFNELHLGPKILAMNLKYFIKYPFHYLKIHGDTINIIWKISPQIYNEWSTVYARDQAMPANYAFLETGATLLSRNLSDFAYTMPLLHAFTNRGGIYLFLIIVLMAKICLGRGNRTVLLLPCLAVIFVPALLFFSCPVPDTRYVLPFMVTSIFLFSLTYFQIDWHTNEKSRKDAFE